MPPIPVQYSGPERELLRLAIKNAFPNPLVFPQFLSDRLDRFFYDYAPTTVTYDLQLGAVLTEANGQAWIADLVAACLAAVPANPKLREFASRHGYTAETPDAHQRLVQEGVLALDSAVWRTRLGVLENQICRIEVTLDQGVMSYGTGFLLGPSVVLTNFHVMEPVYAGVQGRTTARGYSAKPGNVLFRFDYKRLPEGVLNPGVTYSLDAQWGLDSSESFVPVDGNAPADRLDYALVRLSEPAGAHKVGKKDAATGDDRGWLSPRSPYGFAPNSPLFILQHPKGDPLKLVFSTNGVIETTGGGTRVRHRVNTEPGSSGSPCFTQKLELVALHHAGDPDFDHHAGWNQSIPFEPILQLMTQRGTRALLGT